MAVVALDRNSFFGKAGNRSQSGKIKTIFAFPTDLPCLPSGVILVFILVGLACIAIIATIIYRKWQARQRGLQRF
ncbi:BAD_collapsed_G0005860.mRNA.1.CDS.1 [Saccharomyces cerevisiae]|nr:BAD_HP_G0020290.mRNA.1.CDS.1 [Saccharomyces cerevisiae]CAI4996567.1 BAD_HP_G0063290.mRNA.1.CDS.1 [Saccharomyces cerevisiae]CAI6525699.1 BAD_HP_G0020290.mRNA.1.CDS.1 [Saccharomyces cerevisiae]CAI6888140.1 BAD_HP_G0063290.mRNA.1.CDS.1 [Saccharomyces cerevisiae]CAI7169358.1 BAD_collapsed_G0005860.mRNA.1.CDS.1 [Saccharomyces cerevisiae]